jgi:hypothetical protein
MTFQIIPATTEHIRLAARALRPMDRAEIERRGYHVRHLLHLLYRQSPLTRLRGFAFLQRHFRVDGER